MYFYFVCIFIQYLIFASSIILLLKCSIKIMNIRFMVKIMIVSVCSVSSQDFVQNIICKKIYKTKHIISISLHFSSLLERLIFRLIYVRYN